MRSVVITGAAGGLGAAACALLADHGWRVFAADLPGPALCHHAQGVGSCVAVMHHERLAGFDRGADMNAKALTLPFRLILVPVIVQTGFPNRHHLGMLREAHEFGNRRLFYIGGFGMHAD